MLPPLVQAPPLPDMLPALVHWVVQGSSLTRLLPADGQIPTSQVTAQAQVGEAPKATVPSTFCCSCVGQIHLAIWTNIFCNIFYKLDKWIVQAGTEIIGLRSKGAKSYWTIHLFMIPGFRQECKLVPIEVQFEHCKIKLLGSWVKQDGSSPVIEPFLSFPCYEYVSDCFEYVSDCYEYGSGFLCGFPAQRVHTPPLVFFQKLFWSNFRFPTENRNFYSSYKNEWTLDPW